MPRRRKDPRLLLVAALVLSSAGCGLQQAGLEGAVTAGPAAQGQAPVGIDGQPQGAGVTAAVVDPATGEVVGGQGSAATVAGGAGAAGTSGTGGSGGTTGGSGITGGTTPQGASGTAGGAPAPAGAKPLKGELKIGFIAVSGFQDLGRVVNVQTASPGDARAQTAALADYVNKRGGIGGRRLVPVVRDYNAQQASAANDEAVCTSFTEDHEVFAAVLHGQIHPEARDCYVDHRTLAFEGANYGFGADYYKGHAPYLWAPAFADYDEAERALVATLKARRWFAGDTKVGVVRWDDKPYEDILDRTLRPALAGAGIKEVVEASVSNADIAAIQGGLNNAIQTFNAQGVKRVFFLGSAPLQPFFFDTAKNQRATFTYAMTSFDSPRYNMEKYDEQMKGALGIGFSPANDLLDAQHPFPQPGMEKTCTDIYTSYGITFPARVNDTSTTRQAMSYCEVTLLVKAAADKVSGALDAASWSAAAEKLGSSVPMAMTFTTRFAPGDHTGASSYRELTYDASCGCNRYTSGNQAFR